MIPDAILVFLALKSEDILENHCKIFLAEDSSAFLYKLDGECYVNSILVGPNQPVKLSHGERRKSDINL